MSATTHRQRRQRALASFLDTPCIDGKFRDFHGDPRQAPKRWKRLWARQWAYVRGVNAANRLRLQRAKAQKGGAA